MKQRQAKKRYDGGRLLLELEPRVLLSADQPAAALSSGWADHLDRLAPQVAYQPAEISANDASAAGSAVTTAEFLRELVIVDPATPDLETLITDILSQAGDGRTIEIAVLDADRPGLEQINEILAGRTDIAALHIVSHGSDGAMALGDGEVDLDTLIANARSVQDWGSAFTEDGDILIYGCDLAQTADGRNFIDTIARLTGADVAASDDRTGHDSLGGDWDLEYRAGLVEAGVAVSAEGQQNWQAALAQPTITGLVFDRLDYLPNAGALRLDQGGNAVVIDGDSPDFDGGSLTVSITNNNDPADDVLAIANQGTNAGEIGVSGSDVTYGGVVIGTVAGGTGGANLVVSFNANANAEAATALIRAITYENTDSSPSLADRDVVFIVDDGDGGIGNAYATTVEMKSHVEASEVWLSTLASIVGGGAPGDDTWNDGEVVRITDPNLAFGAGTTNGTFSQAIDMTAFGADNVDAVHFVSRDMTVGTNNFQLYQGDVLVSFTADHTLTSVNSLAADKEDIVVFRPTTPGDYSSGTFLMFYNSSGAWNDNITAFTLVEQETTVGVGAGASDLLDYARQSGRQHDPGYLGLPDKRRGARLQFGYRRVRYRRAGHVGRRYAADLRNLARFDQRE